MPHPLVQKNGHGAGLVAGNARSRFETGPETVGTWVPIGTLKPQVGSRQVSWQSIVRASWRRTLMEGAHKRQRQIADTIHGDKEEAAATVVGGLGR